MVWTRFLTSLKNQVNEGLFGNLVKVSGFCAHILLLQTHVTCIKKTLVSRGRGFIQTEGKKRLNNNIKTFYTFLFLVTTQKKS